MISINVEEAYAFDMYSILEVKYENDSNEKNLENLQKFGEQIETAIGSSLFDDILNSNQYLNLKGYNNILFTFINEIKLKDNEVNITAKDIDNLNYERWKAKRDLQEEFFGLELNEVKIGYEKN